MLSSMQVGAFWSGKFMPPAPSVVPVNSTAVDPKLVTKPWTPASVLNTLVGLVFPL